MNATTENTVTILSSEEILQDAFLTDVRPLVKEARLQSGGVDSPLDFYRTEKIREKLISQRGKNSQATGL